MGKANRITRTIIVVVIAIVVMSLGLLWLEVMGVSLREWVLKSFVPSFALQPPPVPPHERTEEGYPLYYLSRASFWGDEIWFRTAGEESKNRFFAIIKKVKKRKRRFKKKDYQDILFSVLIGLLVLGFLAFLAVSNIRILRKRNTLMAQIGILEREIQALEKKNQELRAGIENVSDREYLEKVAREKFLLKEKGEEVIVVSPPEEQEEEPLPKEKNFLEKILEKLEFLPF